MPMYEFECQGCQHSFEVILSSAAAAKDVSCPQCESADIKKVISAGNYRMAVGSGGTASQPTAAGCSARSGFK